MRERGSRHADAANDHNEQRQRHCDPRPNNPAARKAMQASPRTSPLTNNALLVVRRDLSRQYAELIDVPIANEHLDRGYLVAAISRDRGATSATDAASAIFNDLQTKGLIGVSGA
jgi:hypothetical protein